MRKGNELVVAEVSEIALLELPVIVLPVLSTPATLAPISVIARSPIVSPEDTTAALKRMSVPSATYALISEAAVLAGKYCLKVTCSVLGSVKVQPKKTPIGVMAASNVSRSTVPPVTSFTASP